MDGETNPAQMIASKRERLLSLDVFRGITVAGMLLVNNPGNDEVFYWPLDHAEWHGWTPTDLVFPFFLFIVGITTQLSLAARHARGDRIAALYGQIFRRAVTIFLIGIILTWFPFYTYSSMPGGGNDGLLARIGDRILHLRIPGVLQRIAVCYWAGATLALSTGRNTLFTVLVSILLGYWALLMLVPVPHTGATGLAAIANPTTTLGAWIDRGLFDWGDWGNHLWRLGKTWDPEGLLSTVPAIGTVIFGLFAGCWIGQEKPLPQRIAGLLAAGAIAMAIGLIWGEFLPINKKLWTSSYVLFTAGAAAVSLALLIWVIDLMERRNWARPFVVFGVNPILAFAISHVVEVVIYGWWKVPLDGKQVAVEFWFTERFLASWMPEKMASLTFAIFFVLCFYYLLRIFYRRGILLKI